ncbi:hypothetical protein SFMTTN_3324 [Sulfuriferula multivorans]|uniref:Uncharacterized protein n=1 Tax=Sulfuriferula multivorans TaxID=1559896 RepID=A0A401JHN7_9PROT|nr:hypothetical protein [Sulfuriferula multivorans]GBL47484.1 hypothetical protein SFMTTN_3324 [Sulfuriferula multivorans]
MKPVHEQVSLDKAVAGMILVENLSDAEGNMLLPRGAALTESALIILRRRRIKYLHVLTTAYAPADMKTAHALQHQRLTKLFRADGNTEANDLLLRHLLQYRLGENHE